MLLNRKPMLPVVPLEIETAVVHKPHPHDSARLHVRGAAPYVDDIREPAGTLHVGIGMAEQGGGNAALARSRRRARRARRRRRADRGRHSRQERHRARVQRRAAVRRQGNPVPRPAPVRRRRAHPRRRRGAPRSSRRSRSRKRSPRSRSTTRCSTGDRVLPDYEFGRGDVEAALAAAPHRLEGMFRIGGQEHFYLEGQASLAIPGEGHEMLVHASTQDPTEVQHIVARDPRRSRRVRHRRDAPHGRRLRRQGEPGLRLGGDRRARRARHRRALQDPARPRRRFRADRQAPRFPRRLARRLRRCRAHQRLRRRCSTRAAAARPTFRSASSTARCSTPPTAYWLATCASPRAG